MTNAAPRDHGGGVDAAVARWGGTRASWIDLSTGINPESYPLPPLAPGDWTALPDMEAAGALEAAARRFWDVPREAAVLAAPGASALIARIPMLHAPTRARIPGPTYNEHAAAFSAGGWKVVGIGRAEAALVVNPNNPDGRWWREEDIPGAPLTVIDESFADTNPASSLIHLSARPGVVILKSFGKFWGLAGLRLGFAIGDPDLIMTLQASLGPWPVSGPALRVGTAALSDQVWAAKTRDRLKADATRLDTLVQSAGGNLAGGTTLFRLYETENAKAWQDRLAKHHIWSRIFPYSDTWLRLGLPPRGAAWKRLADALADPL